MIIRHELFPTLVGEFPEVYSLEECKQIHQKILNDGKGLKHPTIKGDGVSSDTKVRNILKEFKLTDKISACVAYYLREIGWNPELEVTIKHSWYNIQENGSTLANHNHPNCLISGVLFIHTDDVSSPFTVINPSMMPAYAFAKCAPNVYNLEFQEYTPQPGSVYLFPSYLKHGSNGITNGTENRSVISFNVEEV